MIPTQPAVDTLIAKASTLLEHHLGMSKLGMAPGDVNPKLIEAAQVAVCYFSFYLFISLLTFVVIARVGVAPCSLDQRTVCTGSVLPHPVPDRN